MRRVYAFDHPHESPASMVASLGGKGANLADMTATLGLAVPAGFTISTETCRDYLSAGWPEGLDAEIEHHIEQLESAAGRQFGDPDDPLLLSVRSGAAVSMPGMMDTILNLGLSPNGVVGLGQVSGDRAFAQNCHARFVEMFRATVGVEQVPEDPRQQLRDAIEAVFASWHGERAAAYRTREGINHDLGTAVTVQTMVFGNRGPRSATGVVFTRDPSTGTNELFGDLLFEAQGEDVVAGTHDTVSLTDLERRLPEAAAELHRAVQVLEHHHRDLCDIEFTIEEGKFWLLQVRVGKRSGPAAVRIAVEMAQDPSFPLTRAEAVERVMQHLEDPPTVAAPTDGDAVALTTGLAASPGMASGAIVTTPEAAVTAAPDHDVILVRSETAPADVHGMAAAVGILTATGGLASHAAVVARGWGVPAVVGASELSVNDDEIIVSGTTLAVGEVITINGSTGEVFTGELREDRQVVPEVATLLEWATELGIDVARSGADDVAGEVESLAAPRSDISTAELMAIIAIKGLVAPDGLAAAAMSTAASVDARCKELIDAGLIELAGPLVRLTESGRKQAGENLATDQKTWTSDAALVSLDAFLTVDVDMKQIVTRWQLTDVDAQLINDHSDPDYDAAILQELRDLHRRALAWFEQFCAGLPRLALYLDRLDRALALVLDGDHRFIASPMVDSYHTVWFDLHEDLIRLSGRTRAEETEAGRA